MKKTIIILSGNHNLKANKELSEEIKKSGYNPIILDPLRLQIYLSSRNNWDIIYDNYTEQPKRLIKNNISAILPRIGKGLNYGAFIVEQFNKNFGIYTPQTANALLNASNKMRTLQYCSNAGLRVPKTIFIRNKTDIDFVMSKLGLPVILKTVSGSQGSGVSILDTKRALKSVIDTLLKDKKPIILEEFIGDGTDIRAIVVGNEVVASQIRRNSDKDEFRANLSLGGTAKKTELNKNIRDFCVNASKATGLEVSGVDIMFDKEKNPVVVEVNSNFGWKIRKVTGINIAQHIVNYVVEQISLTDKPLLKNPYKIFDNSSYLNFAYKKVKGKTLDYTNREGIKQSKRINNISDLYQIIENTVNIV